MSIQYAGTGALKSDFTRFFNVFYCDKDQYIEDFDYFLKLRLGKRTTYGLMRDGVNSLQRYFINNFYDGFRQVSFLISLHYFSHLKILSLMNLKI